MPEYIVLRPSRGTFDVDELQAKLLAHPCVVSDPAAADRLLAAADPGALAFAVESRRTEPGASLTIGVIQVRREWIAFAIDWIGPDDLAVMRDLAEMVVATYAPRIFSEVEGDDWTERCAEGLDPMFPPELPPRVAT